MSNPVTVEDFTPRACRERLERIMESGPLTLAVRGAGIEPERSVVPTNACVVWRDELCEIIRHLRTLEANDAPESAAESR